MAKYDGKILIIKEGDDYRYVVKASNGEEMFFSEIYSSEKGCRAGIETIKKNANADLVDIIKDKHNLYHFRIVSKQGRVFGQSASYKDEARARKATESFFKFVQTEVIDLVVAESNSEVINVEVEQKPNGSFIVEEENGEFVYLLRANNKKIIARSQSYKSKKNCIDAIKSFKELVYSGEFKIFQDKNDNYQYKLYNKQNRLVMAGEVYNSRKLAVSAIESIKRFAGKAEIEE